jgi:hypothetical protein
MPARLTVCRIILSLFLLLFVSLAHLEFPSTFLYLRGYCAMSEVSPGVFSKGQCLFWKIRLEGHCRVISNLDIHSQPVRLPAEGRPIFSKLK